jgi:trans-2,3-dihydro-3-hydroxyanthranilate isomerase
MRTLKFHTLDVFTEKPLAGNPLGVVHDADPLDTQTMQMIARELNLSETVFVMAPKNPAHTARIRIFTPTRELPFAGHPTVGTAVLIAEQRFGTREEREAIVVLEEEVGPVRCGVRIQPGRTTTAEFDVPKLPQDGGRSPAREKLGVALGLMPSDIGWQHHKPTVFSAGVEFTFVPVRDRDALQSARAVPSAWRDTFGTHGVYIYTGLPPETGRAFRARMFDPSAGIPEDPATGSAAAAFAGVLARFDALADGRHVVPIEQGIEMGRPSLVMLEIEMSAGRLTGARIGGTAVVVCEGTMRI